MKCSRFFLPGLLLIATFEHSAFPSETTSNADDEYYYIHKTAPYYPPKGETDADILTEIHKQIPEGIGAYSRPGFDYARIFLRASRKDPAALATFLQHCHQDTLSAAGGEMNSSVMLGLLLRWEDSDFAAVVSKQDAATRKDLLQQFWLEPFRKSALKNFACIFPLTAKACAVK